MAVCREKAQGALDSKPQFCNSGEILLSKVSLPVESMTQMAGSCYRATLFTQAFATRFQMAIKRNCHGSDSGYPVNSSIPVAFYSSQGRKKPEPCPNGEGWKMSKPPQRFREIAGALWLKQHYATPRKAKAKEILQALDRNPERDAYLLDLEARQEAERLDMKRLYQEKSGDHSY